MAGQLTHTDIVVIGGGSAGLCAAIAAARNGSKVILVEQSDRLGGMGTLAMVHTFCGLYEPGVSHAPRIANKGLPEEIECAVRKRSGQSSPTKMGKVYVLPQHPDLYASLANDLVGHEDLLDTWFHSTCIHAQKNDDGTFSVSVQRGDIKYTINCRSLIDTSGDGILADFLGATRHCAESKKLQRPAYIFSIQNVADEELSENFRMKLALDLVKAVQDHRLPKEVLGAAIRPSLHKGEAFVTIDLDSQESEWDPTDSSVLQEIEILGQRLAHGLTDFLRDSYAAFQNVKSPGFPKQPGVRESFRWQGEYTITESDLLEGRSFPDTVAFASWPLELRENTKGPKLRFFKKEKASAIPLRALRSSEIEGVYFAGRCLSASHEALASLRVMGTCFATGQAAGMAASLYCKNTSETLMQANKIQEFLGITGS